MAEITLTINGRSFGISCDDGQEQRVLDLGNYIDTRLRDIARAGAASNESHLLVLTSLMLADEVFDLQESLAVPDQQNEQVDEEQVAQSIGHLADRIDMIAERIQKA